MTTAPSQPTTTSPAPGCRTCAGRPSERVHAVSTGDSRGLKKADAVAAEAGHEAHVHQALHDDLFVVVRPLTDNETEQL